MLFTFKRRRSVGLSVARIYQPYFVSELSPANIRAGFAPGSMSRFWSLAPPVVGCFAPRQAVSACYGLCSVLGFIALAARASEARAKLMAFILAWPVALSGLGNIYAALAGSQYFKALDIVVRKDSPCRGCINSNLPG
jgi:hypothetical protein